MINDKHIIQRIRKIRWFSDADIQEKDLFYQSYNIGDIVSDSIDNIECVAVILKGNVEVYSIAEDGSVINLSVLGKDELFGVNNLFYKMQLTTRLKCISKTEIVFLPKNKFIEMLSQNMDLMLAYVELCNKKIQFLIEKVELLSMQSCKNKLIQYLFTKEENGIVELECSKEQLTKKLGVSRATMFREMSELQNLGFIRVDANRITILEEDRLASILYKEERIMI